MDQSTTSVSAPAAAGPVTAREAAGAALRTILNGDAPSTHSTDPRVAPVPWAALPAWRRDKWCQHADTVVDAALDMFRTHAVDAIARELYRQHHLSSGDGSQWTMAHWDHGGDQHVNKEPWRSRARQVVAVLGAAYRTPPTL